MIGDQHNKGREISVIEEKLQQFNPVSLKDINNIKLMNRTDTKYVVHINDLSELLSEIHNNYDVLQINDKRLFGYKTSYFDTKNYSMYIAHHNGKLNRYKIRKRKYLNSGDNFIEIKFKNNKGRTIKTRIKRPDFESKLSLEEIKFIITNSALEAKNLEIKTTTEYLRFTLLNRMNNERITIDTSVGFSNEDCSLEIPHVAIIEIKQEKLSKDSILAKILRDKKIHSTSLSKYCIGSILTNKNIKHNRFKTKLSFLKKINNYEYANRSFI